MSILGLKIEVFIDFHTYIPKKSALRQGQYPPLTSLPKDYASSPLDTEKWVFFPSLNRGFSCFSRIFKDFQEFSRILCHAYDLFKHVVFIVFVGFYLIKSSELF